MEAEESQIQGHPALQTEFEASQVFGGLFFFWGGGCSIFFFFFYFTLLSKTKQKKTK